jgi:cold shock CspA family protein
MRGTMLWFNETKDFGFITTEEAERLYVPGSSFSGGSRPKGRCAGTAVVFRVTERDGGRVAEDVALVPDIVARRARSRNGSRPVSHH